VSRLLDQVWPYGGPRRRGHHKASAAAKKAMAIKYGNTTGHSIKKFLESPFAGIHPKLILKGNKAAVAEAAVTAADAIAVAD